MNNLLFRLILLAWLLASKMPTTRLFKILGLKCLNVLPKFIRRLTLHYSQVMLLRPLLSSTWVLIHFNLLQKMSQQSKCSQNKFSQRKCDIKTKNHLSEYTDMKPELILWSKQVDDVRDARQEDEVRHWLETLKLAFTAKTQPIINCSGYDNTYNLLRIDLFGEHLDLEAAPPENFSYLHKEEAAIRVQPDVILVI